MAMIPLQDMAALTLEIRSRNPATPLDVRVAGKPVAAGAMAAIYNEGGAMVLDIGGAEPDFSQPKGTGSDLSSAGEHAVEAKAPAAPKAKAKKAKAA